MVRSEVNVDKATSKDKGEIQESFAFAQDDGFFTHDA
jgi:hypothetical protein